MDKKRILIVCRAFYPDITPRAFRASELAKEFALQGHEVVVLTPKKSEHVEFENKHSVKIKDLGELRWKTPDFGKSKTGYILTRIAVRFFQLSIEYPDIELMFKVRKALLKENAYDLLISIAVPYPIHWGVASIWRKGNNPAKTWVADCGDPYVGDKTDTFRKWFYFKFVEKWFMRKADYITIPIEEAKEGYFTEFHSKIGVIPQGFKIPTITEADNYKPNPLPIFAYAGSFIPGMRDPGQFLEYLTSLNINFCFYIYTNNPGLVNPYIDKLNGKLIVNDFIPRDELLKKLTTMDFLVNFDNNTAVQLPSKLIDYSIVKRPVLNIAQHFNPVHVHEFLSRSYEHALPLSDVEKYKIENVTDSFLKLISEPEK